MNKFPTYDVIALFPCGHTREWKKVTHIKGVKCCGYRPHEIRAEYLPKPTDDLDTYPHSSMIKAISYCVHPVLGRAYLNGNLVRKESDACYYSSLEWFGLDSLQTSYETLTKHINNKHLPDDLRQSLWYQRIIVKGLIQSA